MALWTRRGGRQLDPAGCRFSRGQNLPHIPNHDPVQRSSQARMVPTLYHRFGEFRLHAEGFLHLEPHHPEISTLGIGRERGVYQFENFIAGGVVAGDLFGIGHRAGGVPQLFDIRIGAADGGAGLPLDATPGFIRVLGRRGSWRGLVAVAHDGLFRPFDAGVRVQE